LRRPALDADPFDLEALARFDRLRVRVVRAFGHRTGGTPVRRRVQESGTEVEGFKGYSPGDDIRYLDWNALGRLDQLVTRRFVAEREVPIHLLLDASASMGIPVEDRKFEVARGLAAAIAYIGLNDHDAVRVAALRVDGGRCRCEESRRVAHPGRFRELLSFLAAVRPSGPTALDEGIAAYLERHGREGGLAVLFSDFLVEEAAYRRGLEALRSRGWDVWAIHLAGFRERRLDGIGGRLELRDAETGEHRRVVLTEAERWRYRSDFEERSERLRRFCHRHGIGQATVATELGIERALTEVLAREGMLRLR
jgi:uncharacterized protein (DUF58 family)